MSEVLPFVSWSECLVCVDAQQEDSNQTSGLPINATISQLPRLAVSSVPSNTPSCEVPMPFTIRPYCRSPITLRTLSMTSRHRHEYFRR